MLDVFFFLGVLLMVTAFIILLLMCWQAYAERSPDYEQERYDRAFRQIVYREHKLQKERLRQMMSTTVED